MKRAALALLLIAAPLTAPLSAKADPPSSGFYLGGAVGLSLQDDGTLSPANTELETDKG